MPVFQPLTHSVSDRIELDEKLTPGRYRLGLWMPEADEHLREDARYAVRVANRDVPWWRDRKGRYGVNILGELDVVR